MGTSVSTMLRGRTGLSPIMIGRHGALDRLQGLVDAAEVAVATRSADGPSIALVSGEAGIGKTRLLREFVDSLPPDVTVLSAQAQPGSMGRPFDVIGQLVTTADGPGPDSIGEAVQLVIAEAVTRGRTLLIVEDLHWADADSVYAIEQLCAQTWPQLVVVGSYRGTDLSRKAPGGELVLRLERQHSVEQVRLERLDRTEVAALLAAMGGQTPTSAAVEAVYRRSGGIPFVVEELVRTCGPDACIDHLRSTALPWSLDEAVRQQLGGLQPDERKVLDALAVFGDPASFELLRDIAELDEGRMLVALRDLVANNVLVEPADDAFWFSHALVADAIRQQLLGRERRRLHERAFAALRSSPSPDHAALARHALGAGQFDLIPAIAREGARRYLDRGASFQALRLASDALAEAPNDPELLAVATDAAWRLEYGTEALAYAEQWRASAVTDLERIESLRFTARLHHELIHEDQRDAVLARLEALFEELPAGMARGRCAGAIAQLHMLAGRNDDAVQWADCALEEARRNGDQWLEAQATVERASASCGIVSRDECERALVDARDLARRVGDPVLECRSLNNLLGVVAPHSARAAWARAELRDAAARSGLDKLGPGMFPTWEAETALAMGDMRAARQALAQVWQQQATMNDSQCTQITHTTLLRIEEGLVNDALALWESRTQRKPHDVLDLLAFAVDGRRTDVERALDRLLAEPTPPDTSSSLWLMLEVGIALVLSGVPSERVRNEYLQWVAPHPAHDFVERHLEGPLQLAEGDATAAAATLAPLVADPDPQLYVPTLGTLWVAYAAALLASGDRSAARTAAHSAVDQLALWPGWRRDRAEALLRRLEGAGRADGELTAREREVAALIAEGLTNGQLAERLYISPKTAAVHVSNILMKLGLSSRVEIAAWAVRHGVVLQPG
jgi:DNA-binding CsgD family transcriptional regulator